MSSSLRIHLRKRLVIAFMASAIAGFLVTSVGANAPAGRFVVGTDVLAGSALDTKTNLVWQRSGSETPSNWAASLTYCADLVANGYDDWRVPTLKEIQTIVDESRINPAVDPAAFPAIVPTFYWTSTPWSADPTSAWLINLANGATTQDQMTAPARVVCTR